MGQAGRRRRQRPCLDYNGGRQLYLDYPPADNATWSREQRGHYDADGHDEMGRRSLVGRLGFQSSVKCSVITSPMPW